MKADSFQIPAMERIQDQEWEIVHIESYGGGGKLLYLFDGVNRPIMYLNFWGEIRNSYYSHWEHGGKEYDQYGSETD